jgi:hypothetical protein
MKQVEFYVFRRLLIASLLIVGCAGLSFGFGDMQDTESQEAKAARETSALSEAREIRATRAIEAAEASEAAEIAEVKDITYELGRNPAAGRANSDVYATPALPLKPEVERLPTPVYAISGVRNQEIQESTGEAVDVVVELPDMETFARGLVEGMDVSDWIINLPPGLEGRAHNVKKGATSIRIYVAGTPTVTAREEIRVRIPGTYLTSGSELQFVSPTETESNSAWEASQTAQQ